ncbi:MAG: succinate dehydrogenase assembly factor 2 [Pseudomonadota bacterium]
MKNFAQLQFLCRHGLKELDLLLSDYLQQCYDSASNDEIETLKQLLQLDDHSLLAAILSPASDMPEKQIVLCKKIAAAVKTSLN